ncbi:methylamine utilization protein [uncultured Piscinibacter sp.]|uniref:methylamine utilization protein n=1 Tax=uncultured Piscinibacter sp. TaxID=1131835 RepID=UPI002624D62E|nr:methylamine utilization protein [uncultured Piscinibacter sp.]
MHRSSTRLATGLAAALAAAPACAASLQVALTDAAGKPLADAVVLLEPASGKAPVKPLPDVEISQAKRQFNPRVTLVTVGTKVHFPNFDAVRHHVYSFSAAKTFELKLYSGVPAAPIVFDRPGIAVLGCNIHDRMAAWVVVADTPWSARSGPDGIARIDAAPAGAYRLSGWHPALAASTPASSRLITVGSGEAQETLTLAVEAQP